MSRVPTGSVPTGYVPVSLAETAAFFAPNVNKTAGARLYIGPTLDANAVESLGEEEGLVYLQTINEFDWTEVSEIESFGDLGDISEVTTMSSMRRRRIRKRRTTRDAMTMVVVVGRDALDPGQLAMMAAEKLDYDYAFKLVYDDQRTQNHSQSVDYFGGIVISRVVNLKSTKDITKKTFSIGINTQIFSDSTRELTPGGA